MKSFFKKLFSVVFGFLRARRGRIIEDVAELLPSVFEAIRGEDFDGDGRVAGAEEIIAALTRVGGAWGRDLVAAIEERMQSGDLSSWYEAALSLLGALPRADFLQWLTIARVVVALFDRPSRPVAPADLPPLSEFRAVLNARYVLPE